MSIELQYDPSVGTCARHKATWTEADSMHVVTFPFLLAPRFSCFIGNYVGECIFLTLFLEWCSESGEKLPFKKRKPYNHTESVVEMEIEEVEDVMSEVKVEDAIMEAKGKCVSVEVEAEDHLTEVKEEDAPVEVEAEEATAEMKEEDKLVKVEVEDAVFEEEEDEKAEVKECAIVEDEVATMMVKVKDATVEEEDAKLEVEEDSRMVEVKVETTKMNELEYFNEDDLQKTQGINYTVTYGCGTYVPYLNFDENQQGHRKQEIGLEETEFEPNERPRRGRKRNRSGQSASSNMPLQ